QVCRKLRRKPLTQRPKFIPHLWHSRRSSARGHALVRASRPKPASAGEVKKTGEGPFRRGLMGSTVCNTPAAHQLAALVERAGGWTVHMAIDAALQAGKDWRPAAEEARRRLADEANRLRARLGPLRGPSP